MNRLQVLFALIVILATAFGKPSGDCKGPVFKINGVNYIREDIKKNINSPESLSYDRSTNTLFMTYHTDDNVYSVVGAKMNLNTKEFETFDKDKHVETTSVDAKTNKVYIQTEGGIYKYDNKFDLYVSRNYSIALYAKMLFTKADIVYSTSLYTWNVYKIENGEVSKFKDLEKTEVRTLVIDDNDTLYFTNETGLYRKKIGSQDVLYYTDSEYLSIYGLSINNADDVYAFSRSSGIYAVSKDTKEMVKLLDVTACGLTFDGDNNMIYADYRDLYRLKPNDDPNCV